MGWDMKGFEFVTPLFLFWLVIAAIFSVFVAKRLKDWAGKDSR